MKILVVDDNKLELQAAKKTLTDKNIKCDIILCDSSLKALEIIQSGMGPLINKEKLTAISRLATGIAHEINNPMAYVSSNLQSLDKYICRLKVILEKYRQLTRMHELGEFTSLKAAELYKEISLLESKMRSDCIIDDMEESIRDSLEGTDRITKIVRSLKEFAHIESEEKFFFCDLNELVIEILMDIRREDLNLPDIITEHGELPLVHCNRNQIRQVFANVIINAIQAIQSQSRIDRGQITIKTYSEGKDAVVEICDDGPGISSKIINSVFDPFFTTKNVGKGMGIGLSVSYNSIVNNHGGELLVASEEGRGTVFTIKLPVSRAVSNKKRGPKYE